MMALLFDSTMVLSVMGSGRVRGIHGKRSACGARLLFVIGFDPPGHTWYELAKSSRSAVPSFPCSASTGIQETGFFLSVGALLSDKCSEINEFL
jgi:hypothetical protein